jgi:hypothetical protein
MSIISKIIKEEISLKNLSDLGSNWSAQYHTLKDAGYKPYVKKGYQFHPVDEKGSIPKNAVYLKDKDVDGINLLGVKIFDLLNKQNELISTKVR